MERPDWPGTLHRMRNAMLELADFQCDRKACALTGRRQQVVGTVGRRGEAPNTIRPMRGSCHLFATGVRPSRLRCSTLPCSSVFEHFPFHRPEHAHWHHLHHSMGSSDCSHAASPVCDHSQAAKAACEPGSKSMFGPPRSDCCRSFSNPLSSADSSASFICTASTALEDESSYFC